MKYFIELEKGTLCITAPKDHDIKDAGYCRFFCSSELDKYKDACEIHMVSLTNAYGNTMLPGALDAITSNLDSLSKVTNTNDLIFDKYPTAWYNSFDTSHSSSMAVFPISGYVYFAIVDFCDNRDADELIREEIVNGNIMKIKIE